MTVYSILSIKNAYVTVWFRVVNYKLCGFQLVKGNQIAIPSVTELTTRERRPDFGTMAFPLLDLLPSIGTCSKKERCI